ncbi:hypothetical protein RB195_023697 [Necator americanus]|uniref:Uncharacterized protein n=1 Tax=Necator americanus TaxID=51031 RepID=A0ABR1EK88_NECAM
MDLEKFYREDHAFYKVIIGDSNAKIGPRRTPEELHIGTHGEMNGFAGYGIAANGLILCKVSQKVEKAVRSYGQGQHFSAKMRATE